MTNIGKPYEGKLHVRFDEEGLVSPALHSTPVWAQSNGCKSLLLLEWEVGYPNKGHLLSDYLL